MPETFRALVLDNPADRVMIATQLKSMGAAVEMMGNVSQALQAVKQSWKEMKPFQLLVVATWFGSDKLAGKVVIDAALEGAGKAAQKPVVIAPVSPLMDTVEYPDVMHVARKDLTRAILEGIVSGLTPREPNP